MDPLNSFNLNKLADGLINLSKKNDKTLNNSLKEKFKTLEIQETEKILTCVFEKNIKNESVNTFCRKFVSHDTWKKFGDAKQIAKRWEKLDKVEIFEIKENKKSNLNSKLHSKPPYKQLIIHSLILSIIFHAGKKNLNLKKVQQITYFAVKVFISHYIFNQLINFFSNLIKRKDVPVSGDFSYSFIIYPEAERKIDELSKMLPDDYDNKTLKSIFFKKINTYRPLKLSQSITFLEEKLRSENEKMADTMCKDLSSFFDSNLNQAEEEINEIKKEIEVKLSEQKTQNEELNEIHSLFQLYRNSYDRCREIAKKILNSKNTTNLEIELLHLTKIILPSIQKIQNSTIASFNKKYDEKLIAFLDKNLINKMTPEIFDAIIKIELKKYLKDVLSQFKDFSSENNENLIQQLKTTFPQIFEGKASKSILKSDLELFFVNYLSEKKSFVNKSEELARKIVEDLIQKFPSVKNNIVGHESELEVNLT